MNAESISYLFNANEMRVASAPGLEKKITEVAQVLLQHFSRDNVRAYSDENYKRFMSWSRISLAAFIPEIFLFPFIYRYATPIEMGIYIALFPTTVSAYRYFSTTANVFKKLAESLPNDTQRLK